MRRLGRDWNYIERYGISTKLPFYEGIDKTFIVGLLHLYCDFRRPRKGSSMFSELLEIQTS